jgi:hypothetical protein
LHVWRKIQFDAPIKFRIRLISFQTNIAHHLPPLLKHMTISFFSKHCVHFVLKLVTEFGTCCYDWNRLRSLRSSIIVSFDLAYIVAQQRDSGPSSWSSRALGLAVQRTTSRPAKQKRSSRILFQRARIGRNERHPNSRGPFETKEKTAAGPWCPPDTEIAHELPGARGRLTPVMASQTTSSSFLLARSQCSTQAAARANTQEYCNCMVIILVLSS